MNQIQIEISKKKALLGQPIDIEVAAKIITQDRERIESLESELYVLQQELEEVGDITDSLDKALSWVDEVEIYLEDMALAYGHSEASIKEGTDLLKRLRAALR